MWPLDDGGIHGDVYNGGGVPAGTAGALVLHNLVGTSLAPVNSPRNAIWIAISTASGPQSLLAHPSL